MCWFVQANPTINALSWFFACSSPTGERLPLSRLFELMPKEEGGGGDEGVEDDLHLWSYDTSLDGRMDGRRPFHRSLTFGQFLLWIWILSKANLRFSRPGPWWWSSSQRARLPSSNPADACSFFYKNCVWKTEKIKKEAGVGPFFKKRLPRPTRTKIILIFCDNPIFCKLL